MEIFSVRAKLMEDFKKNKIDITTLSGETLRVINDSRLNIQKFQATATLEELYLKYLYFLCRLERRINFEYRMIKSDMQDTDSFKRVCNSLFNDMGSAALAIMKRSPRVEDISMGPGGVIILLPEGSPVGRIYLPRHIFAEIRLSSLKPAKKIDHPYLRALFSFLK